MGPSDKTQHAIRRSTRLPLEIPVLVTSLDPSRPASAHGNTTLVNAHGCGLIVPRELAHGIQVRLEIVSAKRNTTARVAEVVPLGGDPETWLVGLELEIPGNFWGIEYAPSDWKIEEVPAVVVASPPNPQPTSAAKPARAPRWRLTDISGGACYLETSEPFPANVPVVISIRAANAECLLEGVVRVSHPQAGMGVEFAGAGSSNQALDQPSNQRSKVAELIGRLASTREVPRIFVGKKEGQSAVAMPLSARASESGEDVEAADPLLDLMREGPSLTAEQFLSDLRAQRLGKRRDPRIDVALPVLLSGTDVSGRPLDQRVMTVNISRRGALLEGIHGMLEPGAKISLARLQKKEQFRVAWVKADSNESAGQIGVAAVDPNTSFWDEVLAATAQSGLESAGLR
jgi:hypothetical protein